MDKANISKGVGLKALNAFVWSLAGVLSTLTVLTAAVVALRIGNFLPNDWDVFFLVPKNPSFEMSDSDGAWENNSEINIFETNENGEVIIAPGMETDYTFKLHNNGNMAIDYDVVLDFAFLHNGSDYALDKLPLVARVYSLEDENYIVGSSSQWVPVSEIMTYEDSGVLGINSYNEYTLELCWPYYESGAGDERDTFLGALASSGSEIEFMLDISTHAAQSEDPDAKGGVVDDDGKIKQVGGDLDPLPFAALVTLTALSGAAFAAAAIASVIARIVLKVKAKAIVPPPPPPVAPKKEEPPAPPVPKAPKHKRVRKKRIINQNPGRWQNHKKLTDRKKRRSKKRRLGL